MASLNWHLMGTRRYETGVDRGVLFLDDKVVAFPGLVSVVENPTGGNSRAFYYDGEQYLQLLGKEQFAATVNAFFTPEEFDPYDGILELARGFSVTQQTRKRFGFSYRTLIGNDTEGTNYGYKIHLVYNALAAPSDRSHRTINNSPSIDPLSWKLTTTPVVGNGYSGSHFVIDSRTLLPERLAEVEALIYGSETTDPSFPTVQQLITIFEKDATLMVIDNLDGTATISGPEEMVIAYSEQEALLSSGSIYPTSIDQAIISSS